MKNMVVLSVIIFLCLDLVCVMSVDEFLSNTWESIRSTWNDILVAIKKPVRPRRLGYIGRRKTRKTTSTTTTETVPMETTTIALRTSTTSVYPRRNIWFPDKELSAPDKAVSIEMPPEVKRITFPEGFPEIVTPSSDSRVKLPYITRPPWRTIEEWQRMQRPHFVKVIREENLDGDFEAIIAATDKLADMKDDERFGVLFFV